MQLVDTSTSRTMFDTHRNVNLCMPVHTSVAFHSILMAAYDVVERFLAHIIAHMHHMANQRVTSVAVRVTLCVPFPLSFCSFCLPWLGDQSLSLTRLKLKNCPSNEELFSQSCLKRNHVRALDQPT
eukprot:m.8253 g.8253  ORF g.8253 m.8253 type:complete len:126 (-) comp5338_c1_seq1:16-393(-)